MFFSSFVYRDTHSAAATRVYFLTKREEKCRCPPDSQIVWQRLSSTSGLRDGFGGLWEHGEMVISGSAPLHLYNAYVTVGVAEEGKWQREEEEGGAEAHSRSTEHCPHRSENRDTKT